MGEREEVSIPSYSRRQDVVEGKNKGKREETGTQSSGEEGGKEGRRGRRAISRNLETQGLGLCFCFHSDHFFFFSYQESSSSD